MARHKISIVRYLNSVPLAWGILEGQQKDAFEPVLSTPAECADQLAAKAVDIGLIPSVEFQRIKGCKIVPGGAIAAIRRVKTVILISATPLWKVRTVAVDQGSRTSVVLARIIFHEFYRLRPDFRPAAPDPGKMLQDNDAALLIGDAALKFMAKNEVPDIDVQKPMVATGNEPLQVFDLMERWKFLTGLPFVFAFWAVRDGFKDRSVADALKQSRDFGLANLTTIAERYAKELELKQEFVHQYLEKNVYYHLDPKCVQALEVFYRMAAKIGAIKSIREIEFL